MDIKKLIKVIKDSVKRDCITVWGRQKDGMFFLTDSFICVHNLELTPSQVGNLISIFGEIPQKGQEIIFNGRGERSVIVEAKYMLTFAEHFNTYNPYELGAAVAKDTKLVYKYKERDLQIFEQKEKYIYMNKIYYDIIVDDLLNNTVMYRKLKFFQLKSGQNNIIISTMICHDTCPYLKKERSY